MARKSKGRYDWENVNKQPTSPAHEKIARKASNLLAFGSFVACLATFLAEVMQGTRQDRKL